MEQCLSRTHAKQNRINIRNNRLWRVGIILQKGLGNHHIFCTAKIRSTNKEGIKQLMDDIEEDLRPLEIYTSNYFKMYGGRDVEELYTSTNQSINDHLSSTSRLDIIRKNIKLWRKENEAPFKYDYEENYSETSETYKDGTIREFIDVEPIEPTEADDMEMNDMSTVIKKEATQKNRDEQIEEEVKIFEDVAFFRRKLQEIKLKQIHVKNLEEMAKATLRRVSKIRAVARSKLRKLNQTRIIYLSKLKALLKKIKDGNF